MIKNPQKRVVSNTKPWYTKKFKSTKVPTNHKKAIAPRTFVIIICPIAPTAIAITPKILLLGLKKKTLPPYSPILLGVKTAIVKPQKTDSTDFQMLISSIDFKRNFHFKASKNQFKSIKRNTEARILFTAPLERLSRICLKFERF